MGQCSGEAWVSKIWRHAAGRCTETDAASEGCDWARSIPRSETLVEFIAVVLQLVVTTGLLVFAIVVIGKVDDVVTQWVVVVDNADETGLFPISLDGPSPGQ